MSILMIFLNALPIIIVLVISLGLDDQPLPGHRRQDL